MSAGSYFDDTGFRSGSEPPTTRQFTFDHAFAMASTGSEAHNHRDAGALSYDQFGNQPSPEASSSSINSTIPDYYPHDFLSEYIHPDAYE